MKALIIEDELKAISALKQEIELNCPEVEVIDTAQDITTALIKIKSAEPDLIFLDIQLSDGLGFDILSQLDVINFKIIFTTAYSKYALEAIKFSALDYLLKPIDATELKLAVEKAKKQSNQNINEKINALLYNQNTTTKRIALQTSEGVFLHEISSIIRCNSDGNYTTVYFENGKKILIVKTLKDFEELLKNYGFERIHHSHLINMTHLTSYINKDGGYVIMSDKTTLPVSQRKRSNFLKTLDAFNS